VVALAPPPQKKKKSFGVLLGGGGECFDRALKELLATSCFIFLHPTHEDFLTYEL
jgi:hypothetical protein